MSAEVHESIAAVAMRCECTFNVWHLILLFLLLYSAGFHTSADETGHEYSKGCAHMQCESGSQCIKRRFWCKNPPCPGMLYCSKSRKESLKGPFTCDTVRCNNGHVCVIRVRGCRWDEKCQQQIARCISEKEYHEGAASCAGFKCPSEKRCILRESRCVSPPCKLVRSCAEAKDVQVWFDKCRAMDCLSEYECFLRKSDDNCLDASCAHTPDCTLTAEDELMNKHCRGWICPRMQKCVVRIVGSCKGFNCAIERSCRSLVVSSSTKHDAFASNKTEGWSTERTLVKTETEPTRQEEERREMTTPTRYPITRKKMTSTAASTRKQANYTIPQKHETEISTIHRQATESISIDEPADASSTQTHSMLSYPGSWWNRDEVLKKSIIVKPTITDKGDTHTTTSRFSDWSRNSSFPALKFVVPGLESATARDTTRLKLLQNIYIAPDDAMLSLPVVLEGINLVGQGYPIWIENEPHRTAPLTGEPYRILLPPYEPVILVEDTRGGQLAPFLTYALSYPFNDAASLSLREIPSRDATGILKTNSNPTNVELIRFNNDINVSANVEVENLKRNHFNDSPDDYANLRAKKKTDIVPPNIPDGESDNHYDDYSIVRTDQDWQPWYVIHDYLEKNKPQSIREKEFTFGIDEFATNDARRNETHTSTDARTLARYQIAHENRDRDISDTQFAYRHNKNLATADPIRVPTERSDYSSEDDEERYGLVNYPYDITTVRDVDKSRGHRGSFLNKILDVSPNQESTFSFSELDERWNGRPTAEFLRETSPYRTYNDNSQKNNDREYDEYYDSHDNISGIEMTERS